MEKEKFLYHGSPKAGLKFLTPNNLKVTKSQEKSLVYASPLKEEAAIFGCSFNDNNSKISWHEGLMKLEIKDKKLLKKYPVSIYKISRDKFKALDKSECEWISEEQIGVIEEIKIDDALEYAASRGVIISTD